MTQIRAELVVLHGAEAFNQARLLSPIDDPDSFEAVGVELSFDHMHVSDLHLGPVLAGVEQSDEMSDYVTVIFVRDGAFNVFYEGERYRFVAGSTAFVTNRASISAESLADTHVTSITLKRGLLVAAGAALPGEFGSLAYSATLLSPILTYVLDLIEVASHTPVEAEPVEANIVQLVTGLFENDRQHYLAS